MQQLTLQFEGYADSRRAIDVTATKQRNTWATELASAVVRNLKAVMPSVVLVAQATLCIAFCAFVMFLSYIFG